MSYYYIFAPFPLSIKATNKIKIRLMLGFPWDFTFNIQAEKKKKSEILKCMHEHANVYLSKHAFLNSC